MEEEALTSKATRKKKWERVISKRKRQAKPLRPQEKA